MPHGNERNPFILLNARKKRILLDIPALNGEQHERHISTDFLPNSSEPTISNGEPWNHVEIQPKK